MMGSNINLPWMQRINSDLAEQHYDITHLSIGIGYRGCRYNQVLNIDRVMVLFEP
jgi:hypothetical protein